MGRVSVDWTYFLPCLWAGLACAGFCLILNVRSGVLICCAGGALGWLVYLLASLLEAGDLLANFLAAAAISVFAELMARLRRCPVTGYLLISCLPLVPGAGIYRTMEFSLQGNTDQFLETGLHTLGIAVCLALGVLAVSSAVHMVQTFRHRRNA